MTSSTPHSGAVGELRKPGRTSRLRILMIASEIAPWFKTGGLADVMAGLPPALADAGHDVTVVVPRYGRPGAEIPDGPRHAWRIETGTVHADVTARMATLGPGLRVAFIESDRHFDREGLYGHGGHDYADNAERFAVLSVAALDLAEREGVPVDVLHGHDWQSGLALLFPDALPGRWPALEPAARVFTIHNLAYQGLFPRETVTALGLPWTVFTSDRAEFWGQVGLLKAGITSADRVTTVSPTYARETLTPEYGCGLDGVLAGRADRYTGILNGIDADVWNPATDPHLPSRYTVEDLAGKVACKRALLQRFGLPFGDDALARPVVGFVGRLVDQKGLDLIKAASPVLLGLDATWIIVGAGESRYERWLEQLGAAHPARVGVFVGFDDALAHVVEAGSDLFLMPSRFEPCGLNQLYSLRYGTVPVVRAVGGLEDTIRAYTTRARRANGFLFREATAGTLVQAVRKALRVYRDRDAWGGLIRQGMSEDHSWHLRAGEYVKVYGRARHDRRAPRIQDTGRQDLQERTE